MKMIYFLLKVTLQQKTDCFNLRYGEGKHWVIYQKSWDLENLTEILGLGYLSLEETWMMN